ncbi:gluconate:H+ symporter [Lewinella sp. W8]|uniref:gluconate:H+ symporter n=1 Tax=Lewinella sp. W8 TaxID=2528208 RepID=UPI00106801EB|nr:gluconate:H+ symporter [Lewinella sp. W8]MTB52621.1 gluconate transporter [Lewinella sp. W8]
MPILITLLAVLLLLGLIIGLKWHPFVALILVAILAGLGLGMGPEGTMTAIKGGVGGTLGGLAMILGLGAVLGGIIAETGAAQVITDRLVAGRKGTDVLWGLCFVGFLIGIPLFYTVAFVMMAPIIFAASKRTGLPLAMVAVATVASLSVTHGFLPPHPAPVIIADTYGADLGKTLLFGLILGVPSVILAGPLLARTLKNMPQTEGAIPMEAKDLPEQLPSYGASLLCALLPVILLGAGALVQSFFPGAEGEGNRWIALVTNATVALLIGVVAAMLILGRQTGISFADLMSRVGKQLAPMAAVLLIIAGGGAFKQVLVDSGTSDYIVGALEGFNAHPILIAWLIAAALRITLGSATVAAITAAGIALPLAQGGSVSPELLVLATGAGSLTCSHVNDTGFWLFKEYFGLTVPQTLRSWTVMETVVSLIGLVGCLGLSLVV